MGDTMKSTGYAWAAGALAAWAGLYAVPDGSEVIASPTLSTSVANRLADVLASIAGVKDAAAAIGYSCPDDYGGVDSPSIP